MDFKKSSVFEIAYKIANKLDISVESVIFVMFNKFKHHITYKEIITKVIIKAINIYGKNALAKLSEIGITSGEVIGKIIYAYVQEKIINEDPNDSIESFSKLFTETDKNHLFSHLYKIVICKKIMKSSLIIFYSFIMIVILANTQNRLLLLPLWAVACAYTFFLYYKLLKR